MWSHDTMWSKMMWLYGQNPFKVGYHHVGFDAHRHSDNGDIVVPVCHAISQDHVIKESCDFKGRILSR